MLIWNVISSVYWYKEIIVMSSFQHLVFSTRFAWSECDKFNYRGVTTNSLPRPVTCCLIPPLPEITHFTLKFFSFDVQFFFLILWNFFFSNTKTIKNRYYKFISFSFFCKKYKTSFAKFICSFCNKNNLILKLWLKHLILFSLKHISSWRNCIIETELHLDNIFY